MADRAAPIERALPVLPQVRPLLPRVGGGRFADDLAEQEARGKALRPEQADHFGPRLGFDLRNLRIHQDDASDRLARRAGARAFTVGSHVFVRRGEDVHARGARVLGHELAHAVQQGRSGARALQRLPAAIADTSGHPIASAAPAETVEVARGIAGRLEDLAELGALTAGDATSESEARRTADSMAAGEPVPTPVAAAAPIARMPDSPGSTISARGRAYLIGLSIPLWHTIVGAPNLTPYTVEQAAHAGTLTSFNTAPGSSFLGAVGEALVWRNLTGWPMNLQLATYVFPNPGTGAIPISGTNGSPAHSVVSTVLGAVSPDLLAVMFGVRSWWMSNQHGLTDVVPPNGTAVQSRYTFGVGQTVVACYEVTTSTQQRFVQARASRVAAWARALSGLGGGSVRVIAVLAIDRGLYFNQLTAAERALLVSTAAGAGAFVQLHRSLTPDALSEARTTAGGL